MSAQTPSAYKGFNLKTGDRVLFFLKVAILALVFLAFGVGATALLTAAACAAMGYEWFRMATGGRDFDEPLIGTALAAAAVPPFAAYAVGAGGGAALAGLGAGFLLILGPKSNDDPLVKAALGIFVIALAGVCFVWLRGQPQHGLALTAWLLAVVVATELGSGFYTERLSPEGTLVPEDKRVPPLGPLFGIGCGVVAGIVIAAFYRDGSFFWVILASLLIAGVVLAAGLLTDRIKRTVAGAPSGSLFMGRGAVIENFDGLVWASLVAGVLMMVAGVLFVW